MANFHEKVQFIWNIAELLRGDYKKSEYADVVLPLTVLRRIDSVLEPTKDKVLQIHKENKGKLEFMDSLLCRASGYPFYNTSPYTFKKLLEDSENIDRNIRSYINGFSENMRNIIESFEFDKEITKLTKTKLLYKVVQEFNRIDLHPDNVTNHEMGTVFEELIRKFSEQSNEEAGEHFTPREVIKLMVRLIIAGNGGLKQPNIIKTIYDPACGTGGMLTIAKDEIKKINPTTKMFLYGQELNEKTWAISTSDQLIKGESAENIKVGNSLSEDKLESDKFDYMISNPPYGVDWKKYAEPIKKEHEKLGFDGRFGAGLPRISDGSFLFLQHMISKMKRPEEGGSRIAIIFNGSPLFTGDAGSGESEIRRWIIENDWLETIVALPDQLFYNTGIYTYIWIVTNSKHNDRKGKVQMIDARKMYQKMRKSLGSKRNFIPDEDLDRIIEIYKNNEQSTKSKIVDNAFFGYKKITVERPLLDEKGKPVKDKQGKLKPDSKLRDFENVPLSEDIEQYFEKEVRPHVPDAWVDKNKTKTGYEINLTRYFYKYKPLRPLEEIDGEIKQLESEILELLKEV